jgi:hypothetical protein
MSLSYPLPPHGMYPATSKDMIVDMPDEVTGEVTAKDLVAPPESKPAVGTSAPSSGSSHSGVGVIGAAALPSLAKAKRAFVPPPPRPAAKSSPLGSPSALEKSSPKAEAPAKLVAPPPRIDVSARSVPASTRTNAAAKPASTAANASVTARPPSAARANPTASIDPAADKRDASLRAATLAARVDAALKRPSSPPSERTHVFRPDLNDPKLRRSAAPTAPPPARAASEELTIPKAPAVPEDIAAASQRRLPAGPKPTSNRRTEPPMPREEDQTRTYSAETMDKLLHGQATTVKPPASAADDVTRVGEIPIEELLLLQGRTSNQGVGHEDVTRVYDLPIGEPLSEVTTPKKIRAAEPLVIVRPEPPKSRWGWWVACGLLVAAASAGWVYRAPLGVQMQKWQSSLVRGVGSPKPGNDAKQVILAPMVTVSVSVSPADARLMLDGAPVPNPFTAQRPADKQSHNLVAEAPGYAPLRRNVQFERDLTVVLALAPSSQTVASPVVTKETPPTPANVRAAVPRVRVAKVRAQTTSTVVSEPSAASSCNPPYVIDDSGVKTYKPECL